MPLYELVLPTDDRTGEARRLAPRLEALAGVRLGLLDNRKGNANVLLERVAEKLMAEHGVQDCHFEEKPIFSRPAPEGQLARLAETCAAVITAIGD
jgi:hypothetical protein